MQILNPNNIKIYDLSAGKSLPDWLTDRRKRSLQKQDVDLRRRIELIQDFDMPTVSNCIKISRDKQYIMATGVYKPRVRCYDVNILAMKFERCFDAEILKFKILSDDYTKMLFLQNDRFLEFHAQHGKYYRTRIPKYGRDFDYHDASCEIYTVGASDEIYRYNLEQGRFFGSLKSKSEEIFCCEFNNSHHLFTCGTSDGHIECWDPRVRNCVGRLDCVFGNLTDSVALNGVPTISSLKYKNALTLGVGTSTGQILLYDLRSSKPILVKDHNFGLPIKDIEFQPEQKLVLSCDTRILKMWNELDGKPFTAIEPPDTKLNNFCLFPQSGLVFIANESPKLLSYYIPSLGPAPKWCSFLDNLTEELEESATPTVYDDYKFVSRTELDSLGLTHLIGSNLLRAYMHGFFLDNRLYNKAKSIAEPFAFAAYRKAKIREKIEEERKNRVQVRKLPNVNRGMAEKLITQEKEGKNKKAKEAANLLADNRFADMFKNPDFQVDAESEEYRLLNPVISKLEKPRKIKELDQFEEVHEEDYVEEDHGSSDESSDDEHTWTKEVKKQHKTLRQEKKQNLNEKSFNDNLKPKLFEIKNKDNQMSSNEYKLKKKSLGDRLKILDGNKNIISKKGNIHGNMEMTFKQRKSENEMKRRAEAKNHHLERKKIRRSAHDITKTKKSKFFMKKR